MSIMLIPIVFLAALISGGALAQTYSEAQLKLAGQIGAVIGLVKRCEIVPLPSASILREMQAV